MNKFREIQGIESEANPLPVGPFDFKGGLRTDLSTSDLAPDSTHEIIDVRIEKGGISSPWGRELIVDTASLVVAAGVVPVFSTTGIRYIPFYVRWNSGTAQYDFYKKDYEPGDVGFVLSISANLIITFAPRYDSYFQVLGSPIVPNGYILLTSLETGIIEWNIFAAGSPTVAAVAGAPNAKVMTNFGDRIVAGWDGHAASEALSWTADGIYNDWTGGDSGQILLLGVSPNEEMVRRDNVVSSANLPKSTSPGAITGLAEVGSNVLAIFRAGSIYRGFETGNVLQALGATPWIQEIGCLAPRTVAKSKVGAIFLGNDYDVYVLSETSISPIGEPIREELREISNGHFKFFSAVYVHATDEYILSFSDRRTEYPDSGAYLPPDSAIAETGTWVINVKEALGGKPAWRKLSIDGNILGGFASWP